MLEHIIKDFHGLLPLLGLVVVLLIIAAGIISARPRKKRMEEKPKTKKPPKQQPISETEDEVIVISKITEQAEVMAEAEVDVLAPPTEEELAMAEAIAEAGEAAALAANENAPLQEEIHFSEDHKLSWRQAVKESLHRRLGKSRQAPKSGLPDPGFLVVYVVGHRSMKYLGSTLVAILKAQGLSLNDKQVFEYNDANGDNFIVASAVNPGTFDMSNLHTFTTPGLSFIIDLAEVKHPKQTFIAMLKMINEIAHELEADILDEHRQRLTQTGINEYMLRIQSLETLREQHNA